MANRRPRRTMAYSPSRGIFAGRRFRTKWEYRKALASAKPRAARAIRSRRDLDRLSQAEREKWSDAIEVLNLMRRDGLSRAKAIKQYTADNPGSRITEHSLSKYAGDALYKHKRTRQWTARKSDNLLRLIDFPTRKGVETLEVRDSRVASQIGAYWNAVKVYLGTGDKGGLRKFRGKTITVGETTYRFITGPKALERLAEFGFLEMDSIYEHSSGAQ